MAILRPLGHEKTKPIHSACTTCMAICGSGVGIMMLLIITRKVKLWIQLVRYMANHVSIEVAAGITVRDTAGRQITTACSPAIFEITLDFVCF